MKTVKEQRSELIQMLQSYFGKKSSVEKKYKLTDETTVVHGDITLYRIQALRDFGDVKKGDLGGFVESEENLFHRGDSWVYDNAKVFGNAHVFINAKVYGNAKVFDNASVLDNAQIYDDAFIHGDALICGNTHVNGNTRIFGKFCIDGDARISSDRDYIVFKNWWSSGRYFTWTRSNDMWTCGCFHGTGKELIEKAYNDSEVSGREYERIVNYVESIKSEINKIKQ